MPCGLLLCAITIKRAVEASFALTMTFQTFQLFLIFHFAFSDVGPLNQAVRDIFNKKIHCSVAAYWSMKMTTYFAGALRCIQRVAGSKFIHGGSGGSYDPGGTGGPGGSCIPGGSCGPRGSCGPVRGKITV